MNYDLDFDTSLLDYHASKVDDLPYLDLFHDDKLDFGEDRQDCADLADAASPNDVIGGLFDSIRSSSEGEEECDIAESVRDAGVNNIAETPVTQDNTKTKSKQTNKKSKKQKKEEESIASNEQESEEAESKRPRRSARQYNLRQTSIINRIETETRRAKPKQPKPKSKPPPLSKYRRRTANSRERTRMAEINDAFEVLRKAVPNCAAEESSKLTKITTLRLALNYIGELREMLGYAELPADPTSTTTATITAGSATVTATVTSASVNASASKSSKPSVDSKTLLNIPKNSKSVNSVNVSCSADVTLTKDSLGVPTSADPALDCLNTDPFSDFNLAVINFPSTVPSPGPNSAIPSPDNLSCINTNMNCLSPGTMNCLSPESMNCVSPSLSLTCSSPGSSISDNAANYYGLPYMGLNNPLDSEGESVTSLS